VIGIILLTFARLAYARRTLEAVAQNLQASEPFWLHIADDGSPQEYRDELWNLGHKLYGENVSMTNSERGGYGANYNLATQTLHFICDLVLPLEDDWELLRPLDLDPIARVLREGYYGCVRMGYIGFTQQLNGHFDSHAGYHWLALEPDSPEPHVFAGGPRLESVAWQRRVGPWPEGLPAGETEFHVAHIPEARQGVAWPVDLIFPRGDAFVHIGTEQADNSALRTPQEVAA